MLNEDVKILKHKKDEAYQSILATIIDLPNYKGNMDEHNEMLASVIVTYLKLAELEIEYFYWEKMGKEARERLEIKIKIEKEKRQEHEEIIDLEAQWNPEDFKKRFGDKK